MRQGQIKLAWVNPSAMANSPTKPSKGSNAVNGGATKTSYKSHAITAVISAIVALIFSTIIPNVFTLFSGQIKTDVVKEINSTLTPLIQDIGQLKTQVAVIKNSVDNLEKLGPVGRLKTQATKLGIQNPQINTVNLKDKAQFTATFTLREQPNSFIELNFIVEEVTKDRLIVAVSGKIVEFGKVYDQFGPERYTTSQSNKVFTYRFTGKTPTGKSVHFPSIQLAILDRDETNNLLTVATGLASSPTT